MKAGRHNFIVAHSVFMPGEKDVFGTGNLLRKKQMNTKPGRARQASTFCRNPLPDFICRKLWLAPVLLFVMVLSGCQSLTSHIANSVYENLPGVHDDEVPPTPAPVMPSSDVIGILGGKGAGVGCSIPAAAEFLGFEKSKSMAPVSLQFRQACVYHDYCYRHGEATYGYTKEDCDFALQRFSYRLCRQIEGGMSHEDCETRAKKVLLGVRLFGSSSFNHGGDSSFFEFDSMPDRADAYSVSRIVKDSGGAYLEKFDFKDHHVTTGIYVPQTKNFPGDQPEPRFNTFPIQKGMIPTPPIIIATTTGEDAVSIAREKPTNTAVRFIQLAQGSQIEKPTIKMGTGASQKKQTDPAEFDCDQSVNLSGPVDKTPSIIGFSHRYQSVPSAFVVGYDALHSNQILKSVSQYEDSSCDVKNKLTDDAPKTTCDYYRLLQHTPLLVNGGHDLLLFKRGEGNDGGNFKEHASLIMLPLQRTDSGSTVVRTEICPDGNRQCAGGKNSISEDDEPLMAINAADSASAEPILLSIRAHAKKENSSATLEVFVVGKDNYRRTQSINLNEEFQLDQSWLSYPVQFVKYGEKDQTYAFFARFCPDSDSCRWPEKLTDTRLRIQFRFFKLNISTTSVHSSPQVSLKLAGKGSVQLDTLKQIPDYQNVAPDCQSFPTGDQSLKPSYLKMEQQDFVRRWRQSQIIPVAPFEKGQNTNSGLGVSVVFSCKLKDSLILREKHTETKPSDVSELEIADDRKFAVMLQGK